HASGSYISEVSEFRFVEVSSSEGFLLLELESNISEGDDDMGSEIFGAISSTALT
ncbi:20859_t:CDS:2, partial [Gigaspora rosea]